MSETSEFIRIAQLMKLPNSIFVFGSNLAGIHGAGAAKDAALLYGARRGFGLGLQGRSYAIPTKDERIKTLPLSIIGKYIYDFVFFTHKHPTKLFAVTRIGCGLAGYKDEEIAPYFYHARKNCELPPSFQEILYGKV